MFNLQHKQFQHFISTTASSSLVRSLGNRFYPYLLSLSNISTSSSLHSSSLMLKMRGRRESPSVPTSQPSSADCTEIEELHRIAVLQNYSNTYIDPATDFMVFTELAHLKRGTCCGNHCRHCPYGWVNVPESQKNLSRHMTSPIRIKEKSVVQSGDKSQIQQLLAKYQEESTKWNDCQQQILSQEHQIIDEKQLSGMDCTENIAFGTNCTTNNCGNGLEASTPSSMSSSSTISKTTPRALSSNTKIRTGGRHGGVHTNKNVPYTRTGDKGTSQLLTGERRRKDDLVFSAMGDVDELCSITGVVHAHLMEKLQRERKYLSSLPVDNSQISSLSIFTNDFENWLLDIMSRLFDVGSHIAKPRSPRQPRQTRQPRQPGSCEGDCQDDDTDESDTDVEFIPDGIGGGFASEHVTELEGWIDQMTEALPELTSFILPTGCVIAAQLHVARTVCRRAERSVTSLPSYQLDSNAIAYLNRLSDFYFTAARYANYYFLHHQKVNNSKSNNPMNDQDQHQQCEILYRRPFRGAKQRNRVVLPIETSSIAK